MISKSVIDQVVDRADIVDVVSDVVQLKKSGANYKGCCPFHNEKTPSFIVNASRNSWHCFGACNEGGDAISFVMKYYNMNFIEAVEKLANHYGINISKEDREENVQNREQELKREAMFLVYNEVQHYFVANFKNNKSECVAARQYAFNRWNENFCHEIGIGYATSDWQGLVNFANEHGISEQSLLELGLICKSEKNGRLFDFYRERITIPIKDRYGRIIGYTARYIGDSEDTAKYLNPKTNILYNKDNSVFGINVALREAAKADKFYLVEGAPDVLRLQSIGVNNVIASLGSAWTENQFSQLKRHSTNLCFIPDADPPKSGEFIGTGIKSVIKNAQTTIALGFNVTVKEIPFTTAGVKNDPDSYILNRAILSEIEEVDFIPWYASKLFHEDISQSEKKNAVETIANLIAGIDDELREKMYVDILAKMGMSKPLWNKAINFAKKRQKEEQMQKSGQSVNLDLLHKYGFQERNNQYIAIGKDGDLVQWSNFTMRPLFHIKDAVMPLRLFELKNVFNQVEIVELKQEDLVSLSKFKQKVEGLGNFVWLAKEEQLTKLKMFLYESTDTAVRIDQLGWQRQGFYAFGNGVFSTEWHAVDDLGIVRLQDIGNFYLPAFSKIYADDTQFYQFERSFVHYDYNAVSLQEYCNRLISVFGDNAKVGIAFLLASLFRDVVVSTTKSFPILNLFGPKGSGKSELGHSLMSFFIIENTPPNIQNSTVPALADTVAQSSNALVHLDEFKNDVDIIKREFLKGLWDGTGRNRMSMERDKKREITRVSCGVIVSGQEMATADIALFTRFIFLSYAKSEFSREAKRQFEELRSIRKKGCSHLTLQIIKYRKRFEAEFNANYNSCLHDLMERLEDAGIEDRILRNWLIPLAAFRTLEGVLHIPFTYADLLDVCSKGIRNQNAEVKQNNELADFWKFVSFLQQDGKAWLGSDFKVMYLQSIKCKGMTAPIEYTSQKPILFLRFNRISHLFESGGKSANVPHLPVGSLIYYLENSSAYIGKKNVRFDVRTNGVLDYEFETSHGKTIKRKTTAPDLAMCFDYRLISDTFGINLETSKTKEEEDYEND